MKRKFILTGVVVVVLIGLGIYLYGGSQTPPGQAPLVRLTIQNASDVKNAFNASADQVRVVLFLSPT
jgi:hypothetical protein